MGLDAANPNPPQPLIAPPEFTSFHRCFLVQLRTSKLSFTRLLTAAEVLGLQEFEPVLQLRVRHSRGLGLDAVIRHFRSPPPPRKSARAGKHRKALGPPITIAYVPDSLSKCHPNYCHRVMGATGSGKTSVSRRGPFYSDKEAHPSPALVYQSRESFEPTNWDEFGIVYGRGPTRGRIHSRWKKRYSHRHPGVR